MAARERAEPDAVSRIWRAFALQPHRAETFKLSRDPLFIEKVRDIVGLYLAPPDKALVLCSDEKSRSRRWIAPSRCCRCARARWNAGRMTTAATGPRRCSPPSRCRPGRSSASATGAIAASSSASSSTRSTAAVPAELDVHLILDNYGTHKTPLIRRWLAAAPRFHLHFTPTGRVVAQPGRALVRAAHGEADPPRRAPQHPRTGDGHSRATSTISNEAPKPFVWTKTADEILAIVARFCQRTSDSGH